MLWEKLFLIASSIAAFPFLDSLKLSVSEVQYGRELAGFSYNYSPEDEIKYLTEFPQMAELVSKKSFKGKTGIYNNVETRCGFIAENPHNEEFIVAIRGTNGLSSFADWATNLKMYQIVPEYFQESSFDFLKGDVVKNNPKKIHAGFYRYACSMIDSIWNDISERLNAKFEESDSFSFSQFLQTVKISLYGHSTGGSVSQVVALMIANELIQKINEENQKKQEEIMDVMEISQNIRGNIKVFTYAAPKIFNSHFADVFNEIIGVENHVRIVQKSRRFFDPTILFPIGNFKQTGTLCEIYIDKKEDLWNAGPILHDMIPHITIENLKPCID